MPTIDIGQLRKDEVDKIERARSGARAVRKELLKKLIAEVGHPVVCYATANRQQLGTQIGGDTIGYFREHLDCIGTGNETLGLYLITRGGNTLVPHRLVALFREHCKRFVVFAPFMAHSAGTLIALGADQIVMGPMGELGPVDPTVTNQFNPVFDSGDAQGGKLPVPRPRIPISVEDVTAYLALAREKGGLSGESMVEAFRALTDKVHPLALGNINRQHMLIRRLVRRLLSMHMDSGKEKESIEQITETLTEKLYAHEYVITREEARNEMHLKVQYPSQLVEQIMWMLYKSFEESLLLEQEIDVAAMLGSAPKKYVILDAAAVETEARLDLYSFFGWLTRKSADEIKFDLERSAWEEIREKEKSDETKKA